MNTVSPAVLALAASAGGAIGAFLRHLANVALAGRSIAGLMASSWLVNIAGCFLAGLLLVWIESRGTTPFWRVLIVTGVLGGLTTFSAIGLDLLQLLREGRTLEALLGAAGQIVLGVAAVALGFRCGRLVGIA